MTFLFLIAIVAFIFLLRRLQQRVDRLEAAVNRLWHLERRGEVPAEQAMPANVPPAAVAPIVSSEPAAPPGLEVSQPSPATKRAVPPKEPTWAEPETLTSTIRALWKRLGLGGVEWEAIIGGNWLNKLGVLIFVIGLALFVGYSLKELGPLGRVAVGVVVSIAMLIAGVMLERQARYTAYGRGLIGGGWAGLYFTTYAAHGIAVAKLITNPAIATALLILIALGMILHSLRYRSEAVTGLAYFVAFATLAVSPLSDFAVVASVPLAASLLYIAQRFRWHRVMIAGLAVTYGSYLLSTAGEPVSITGFIRGQAVIATYWLLFELFDLIETARTRRAGVGAAGLYPVALFPLNACAFVGTSLLEWSRFSPHQLDILLISSAGAFLIDALVRVKLRPPQSFEPGQPALERAAAGGYEGSVTVASAAAAAAAFIRFSGLDINIALLLEAEMLILAGLNLNEEYLQILGGLVFVLPASKLIFFDLANVMLPSYLGVQAPAPFLGLKMGRFSLVAALTATAAYCNRWLAAKRYETKAYSYFATAVALIVILLECPINYRGLGCLILAAALFEAGLRAAAGDLRTQGYAAGALGALILLGVSVFGWPGASADGRQVALAVAVVINYALALEMLLAQQDLPADRERQAVRDCALGAGNAFAALLLWYVLPAPILAVGWMLLALVLIEVSLRRLPLTVLRLSGYGAAALAYGRLLFANFINSGYTAGISHRLLTVLPVAVSFYWLAARLRSEEIQKLLPSWERQLWRWCQYGAGLLIVLLIGFEMGRAFAVVGWALMMLVLLYLGIARGERDLRWQSYIIAILVFTRGWAINFFVPGALGGIISVRLLTASLAIAALYGAEFISPRTVEPGVEPGLTQPERILAQADRHARVIFALLATALLTLLLYNEVPGDVLTEAWALEGMPLLIVGFTLREGVLRLCGLLLLGACVFRVFLYDLRNLETLPRIVSFIVLGLLMLAVSFIYTRYYERLKRYL